MGTERLTQRLGLDWDETVTEHPNGFRTLCRLFDEVYIVTLNQGVRRDHVQQVLGVVPTEILRCPDEVVMRGQSHEWKALMCTRFCIDLMFDDDPQVIRECRRCGIPSIGVADIGPSESHGPSWLR